MRRVCELYSAFDRSPTTLPESLLSGVKSAVQTYYRGDSWWSEFRVRVEVGKAY
jgi:hypothetical protein